MNPAMRDVISEALQFGFTNACALEAATLLPRQEVRDMCAADRCRHYGKLWTCPPACASLEENSARLLQYKTGVLVQTTGTPEDDFDYEGMAAIGQQHMRNFLSLLRHWRGEYPQMLALGSGGCGLCEQCTYPTAPCRHPHDAVPSMEAFGLVVSDVCTANGAKYYYGPGTMTYTACFLLE